MTFGGDLEERIRTSLAVLAPTRLELRDDSAAMPGTPAPAAAGITN